MASFEIVFTVNSIIFTSSLLVYIIRLQKFYLFKSPCTMYSRTTVGSHPDNVTTLIIQLVFYSPELFPIILNTMETH